MDTTRVYYPGGGFVNYPQDTENVYTIGGATEPKIFGPDEEYAQSDLDLSGKGDGLK